MNGEPAEQSLNRLARQLARLSGSGPAVEPLLSGQFSANYQGKKNVLKNVSIDIAPGEILGLVGQSGAGKSTIAMSILGLLRYRGGSTSGELLFRGRDLMRLPEREMRQIRGKEIALVPQSPIASLNPVLRIGSQMAEALRAHQKIAASEVTARLLKALASVSLPAEEPFLKRYPREISVGQAQRVLIAMATLHHPPLLLADEPTSALDAITQSEILKLFARLNRDLNLAILYISHDLMSVASLCHRIAILHDGQIAECGTPKEIFAHPQHSYSQQLIESLPGVRMAPAV